jgi:hypothetical protein
MKKIVILLCLMIIVSSTAFGEDSTYGEALKDYGLIQGDGSGLNETGSITREAMIKMVVSLTGDLQDNFQVPESPTFTDVSSSHWSYEWVERAYGMGLTKGIGGGQFGLGQAVTKQQACAFMLNALQVTYTYDQAVEVAGSMAIDSQRNDAFNRGHVFEMVAKTLLKPTKASDKALYESNQNFDDKDFKAIFQQVTLDRQNALEASEAQALLDQEISLMTKYRETWPVDLEAYGTWLDNIDMILHDQWQKIDYVAYDEAVDLNTLFVKKGFEPGGYNIDFKPDQMILRFYGPGEVNASHQKIIEDIQFYYAPDYQAYKVTGLENYQAYTLIHMKDQAWEAHKGFLKGLDQIYYASFSTFHDLVKDIYTMKKDLDALVSQGTFTKLAFEDFAADINQDMNFEVHTRSLHHVNGDYYSSSDGYDQYSLKFSQMNKDSIPVYFNSMEQAVDFIVGDPSYDEKLEVYKISLIGPDMKFLDLIIQKDSKKAYFQYDHNLGGFSQ